MHGLLCSAVETIIEENSKKNIAGGQTTMTNSGSNVIPSFLLNVFNCSSSSFSFDWSSKSNL